MSDRLNKREKRSARKRSELVAESTNEALAEAIMGRDER
jgi:hypothetical protein